MSSVWKINKLHFIAMSNRQILICAAVMALHVIISAAVIRLVDFGGPAGGGDIITMCYMLVMGIVLFPASFKYIISQGISRRTFFIAESLSLVMLAIVFTAMTVAFYAVNLRVSHVWMVYESIYRGRDFIAFTLWEFGGMLFLGLLGWFICLVYYLVDLKSKILITIAPFIVVPLAAFFDALADGALWDAILGFLKTVMGYDAVSPNPYIGTASLLAAAVILAGLVLILTRRAPIKE